MTGSTTPRLDDEVGKPTATFLETLSQVQAAIALEVHRTIAASAPELLPPERQGAMLGYGRFHYRYASGREGDAHLVAARGGSKHLSIYVSALEDDTYLPEARAAELGKVSVGRSCIRVRRPGELDLDSFGDLVRRAVQIGGAGQTG